MADGQSYSRSSEPFLPVPSLSQISLRMRVMRPEHLAAIAISVGRPKDRARLVYLCSLPGFERRFFDGILKRHGLWERWRQWASSLEIDP